MADNERWSREELILALNLYLNKGVTPAEEEEEVQKLAGLIGRTPGAVGSKMANFAHFDPNAGKGFSNFGKRDQEIWEEYYGREDRLREEAERIRSAGGITGEVDEQLIVTEEETVTRSRQGTVELRKNVRSRYRDECVICDVEQPALLEVAHILPWSEAEEDRGNLDNTLLMCVLHHAAFDRGFFTLDSCYRLRVNPEKEFESSFLRKTLTHRSGERIRFPEEAPSSDLLRRWNENLDWILDS